MQNFFIINKSGGLIYTLNKNEEINKQLILISSLHTIYAFITEMDFLFFSEDIEPLVIVLSRQTITLFKSITGYAFVFVDDTAHSFIAFQEAYRCFVDYALKDPFYTNEMPVNSVKFENNIQNVLKKKRFFSMGK